MKDKLKNTLEHEVELLGRSISVLAIAGLLVVGGASAALLSSFATVDGTAEVDQAVIVNEEGQTELGVFGANYGESATITAGATTVDTFEITNNMGDAYSPVYDSELEVIDSDDSVDSTYDETGSNVDWTDGSDNQVGIDTTYANYFTDAGHDFSAVEVDTDGADITVDDDEGDDSGSDNEYATISEALSNAGSNDVVYVESHSSGSYDGFTVDVSGVTVASTGASVDGQIAIDADDVTVEGFDVAPSGNEFGANAFYVQTDEITSGEISNNRVSGYSETGGTAVYLDHEQAASNLVISNNRFEDNWAGIGGTESFEGSIEYNVFKSNDEAIGVGDDEFSTEGNRFEDNTASFKIYSTGPYKGSSVDANNNFFAEPFNIDYNGNEDVTDVSASYETVDSVPAGETVTVGVVNDFDLMINGAYDYSLTTDITTSEATE